MTSFFSKNAGAHGYCLSVCLCLPELHGLSTAADNEVLVYIDGTLIQTKQGWGSEIAAALVDACVLAVEATNWVDASPYGFMVSAGDDVITDTSWRCSSDEEDGWMLFWFNDSHWQPAAVIGANGDGPWGNVGAISHNAQWIWSSTYSGTTYCRKVVC